jgi:hypothetical protein
MMKTPEELAEEYEIIECDVCHRIINGEFFWVVSDFQEPMTVCERCYLALQVEHEKQ